MWFFSKCLIFMILYQKIIKNGQIFIILVFQIFKQKPLDMKKFFSFLFALVVLASAHAQSSFHPMLKQMAPGHSLDINYSANTLRSGATSMVINYDSADRYYTAQHSGDTMFPPTGQFYIFPINSNYDTAAYFTYKYAMQTYDTLINVNNHFAGMAKNNAVIRLDSFEIVLSDSNGTHSKDTVTLSVFDKTAATETGSGLTSVINTTALWHFTYGDSVNFFGPGSGNFVVPLVFHPNVTLPAGHTFGIRIDFKGNVNDNFTVAASFRNDCGNGTADFTGNPNAYAPHNSSSFFNVSTLSQVVDWNTSTAIPQISSSAVCDYQPMQNLFIFPYITVTPGNVGIEAIEAGVANFSVYPNPSNGVFTASLRLESASDVTISVLDMTGKKIFESTDRSVQELNKSVDLSAIAAGVYVVNVKTDNGSVNQRIVIK